MDKRIDNLSIPDLQKCIEQKEIEYREALKAKKLFWEVKMIFDQKRKLERQLQIERMKQVK